MIQSDHYWIIGGDETRVFSSKRAAFVPANDPEYLAWLARGPVSVSRVANAAVVLATLWRANQDYLGLAERCRATLGNPPCRRRFKPGEFLAELTAADAALLSPALASTPAAWLRWQQMLAWVGPLDNKTQAVQNFFAWLATVLGQPRVTAIRAALGLIDGP